MIIESLDLVRALEGTLYFSNNLETEVINEVLNISIERKNLVHVKIRLDDLYSGKYYLYTGQSCEFQWDNLDDFKEQINDLMNYRMGYMPYQIEDHDGNRFGIAGMENNVPLYRGMGGLTHIFDPYEYKVIQQNPPRTHRKQKTCSADTEQANATI